jgi:hypothetical protein
VFELGDPIKITPKNSLLGDFTGHLGKIIMIDKENSMYGCIVEGSFAILWLQEIEIELCTK